MMSSVMPSLKYSCSESPLILMKGRTATDAASGSRGRRDRGFAIARRPAPNPDRTGDVLHLMVAGVLKRDLDLSPDLLVDRLGNTESTLAGQTLQAGRHIDSVTKEVVVIDDDVAQVDADPKAHLSISRNLGVVTLDLMLDVDRASNRFDRARELGHDAVAGPAKDPPVVIAHEFLDDGPIRAEPPDRVLLVDLHQPAVTDHIGRQNRGELALNPWSRLS